MSKDNLTLDEVAAIFKVKIGTIYEWMREGKLPFIKIGNKRYIKREVVEKIMKDGFEMEGEQR